VKALRVEYSSHEVLVRSSFETGYSRMAWFLRKLRILGGDRTVNSAVPAVPSLHHGSALQGSDGLTKEFQWPAIILWMIWLVGMGNVWLGRAIRGVNATPRTVFMYGLSTKTRGEHRVTGELHHKATLPTNWPITKLRFQSPLTTLRIRQLVDQHRQPTAQPNGQPTLQPTVQSTPTSYASHQTNGQPSSQPNSQPRVGSRDSVDISADPMTRKSLNSLEDQ
jgi:hypothetical protein